MLSSTAAPDFYPHQFVLVTDILEKFGADVYGRIIAKANKDRAEVGMDALPENFRASDVPLAARETAKNWFCIIGDIMELVPRFYGQNC